MKVYTTEHRTNEHYGLLFLALPVKHLSKYLPGYTKKKKNPFKIQVYENKITDKPDKKNKLDTIKFWGISSQELGLASHSELIDRPQRLGND